MYIKINGESYEVATNLGTTYDLEKKFNNKKVRDILSGIEEYDLEQLISILYVGFKRKNPNIDYKTFSEMVLNDNDFNYIGFIKELSVFCNLCLSVNSKEEEVREKLNKLYDMNFEEVEEEIEHFVEEENEKN